MRGLILMPESPTAEQESALRVAIQSYGLSYLIGVEGLFHQEHVGILDVLLDLEFEKAITQKLAISHLLIVNGDPQALSPWVSDALRTWTIAVNLR